MSSPNRRTLDQIPARPKQSPGQLGIDWRRQRDSNTHGGYPGAVHGAAFLAYVTPVLASSLRPGQVIILDNLSAHKGMAVREAIAAVGCELCFLPPYSPGYNPIELAFSVIKTDLRAVAARDPATLQQATAQAIDRITPAAVQTFQHHCGFALGASSWRQSARLIACRSPTTTSSRVQVYHESRHARWRRVAGAAS